jgi:hypothetical protein
MGESLRVTIVYEPGDDGSIVDSNPEVLLHAWPGAHARGGAERRDRREAEATHSA